MIPKCNGSNCIPVNEGVVKVNRTVPKILPNGESETINHEWWHCHNCHQKYLLRDEK